MKRILFAAGLIAASPIPALAGQIHDEFNACLADNKANLHDCLQDSRSQGERSLCVANAYTYAKQCADTANFGIATNPESW